MPAKDFYHDNAKQSLINDGWAITHDPLVIRLTRKRLYVDLGFDANQEQVLQWIP
ncbi:element excision factor XisH family protein [Leptothoe sp. ISB3NOV94-8A]